MEQRETTRRIQAAEAPTFRLDLGGKGFESLSFWV